MAWISSRPADRRLVWASVAVLLLAVGTASEAAAAEPAPSPFAVTNKHRLWSARLGRLNYSSPAVGERVVVVGTTIDLPGDPYGRGKDKAYVGAGAYVCVEKDTGRLRWRLPTRGLHYEGKNAWWFGMYGVCSKAAISGDRAYVVGSSGDVMAVDVRGLGDGNDGAFQDELGYINAIAAEPREALEPTDADILWRYDMAGELQIPLHDAQAATPLLVGGQLWVATGRGFGDAAFRGQHPSALVGENGEHVKLETSTGPVSNIVVLDAATGRLLAADAVPVPLVYHGQWSSPVLSEAGHEPLVLYPDGYGFLHAYKLPQMPQEGDVMVLETAWSVDCVPPSYRVDDAGREREYEVKKQAEELGLPKSAVPGPSEIIGTPAVGGGLVYVALGRDQNHGPSRGALSCFDPRWPDAGRPPALLWRATDLSTTMGSPAVSEGVVYLPTTQSLDPEKEGGMLYAFDARTGERLWDFYLGPKMHLYTSPVVHGGRVYMPSGGRMCVLRGGREGPELLADGPFPATAPAALHGGRLYTSDRRQIMAYELPQAD
jgi:outer membrane protein assembly factor BamB